MTQAEREKVIRLLTESEDQFMHSIEGLSEVQWRWKPAPERWSVAECSEHIILAERSLFAKMQEALANPPNPDWEKKTVEKAAFIERVMPARTGKAKAPEDIVPSGKLSHSEVVAEFKVVRARSLQFAQETQAPLKEHTSEHPFAVFNTLNAYDWLIYIPLHNIRHVKQIEEVKATAGFPAH